MVAPLFEIAGVSKSYADSFALRNVSFQLSAPVTGLIGPNGSGKTTLLESIAGLIPIEAGTFRSQGRELSIKERKQHLFYLPDHLVPYSDAAVSQVADFFCAVFRVEHSKRDKAIQDLGLHPVLQKRVGQLSKGFRKRLCLSISLWAPQKLLLLDEPFDGLDFRQTISVMEVLRETAKSGKTLLLSIHQLADAERICDRFVLLNQGSLVAEGSLRELRERFKKSTLEEVFLGLT